MNFEESVILDFIKCPEVWWAGNARQEKKSKRRLARLKSYYEFNDVSLSKIVIEVSRHRASQKIPTIYLPSMGSSGSHLFQHILMKSFGVIGLNEVYTPPKLQEYLRSTDVNSDVKKIIFESYHLLHASPRRIFSNKEMVNTAHKPDLKIQKIYSAYFKSALLLRNPVDVVLSRTFRKQEYRDYLGLSNAKDKDYLAMNIDKSIKFFKKAFSSNFDAYFLYEDMLKNPEYTAKKICKFMGEEDAFFSVHDVINESINSEKTNKYKGPEVFIPDSFRELTEEKLAEYKAFVVEKSKIY